jgi:hypothetical protein
MELRRARHGEGRPAQLPHVPWSRRLRRSSSPSRASPRASCRRSPRRRRCGRRRPRQSRVPSRCGTGAPVAGRRQAPAPRSVQPYIRSSMADPCSRSSTAAARPLLLVSAGPRAVLSFQRGPAIVRLLSLILQIWYRW